MRVPQRRSLQWSALSAYTRAMGAELYRVHGADASPEAPLEVRVPTGSGAWKGALARSLEVDGVDRPPFHKALDAMVAAGVLVVLEGRVLLLFTDSALHRHGASTPEPRSPHDGGTPGTRSKHGPDAVEPRSQHGPDTVSSRSELSTRNGLARLARIDREKEREKEKERGGADARALEDRPPATLDGELRRRGLAVSTAAVVRDLLAEATRGAPWPVDRWGAELLELGRKPLQELERVLQALSVDAWIQATPVRASPTYVLNRWNHYATAQKGAEQGEREERGERVRRLRIARDTARMGVQQTDGEEREKYQRELEQVEITLRQLG